MLEMVSLNERRGKGHHRYPPRDAALEGNGRGLACWEEHQRMKRSTRKDLLWEGGGVIGFGGKKS